MIRFREGGILVQRVEELPHWEDITYLFGDFETSSRNPKKDSLNPHVDCWVLGFAVTVDSCPNAYYVPHELLRTEQGRRWLVRLFDIAKYWVNQNVKYDCQVLRNDLGIITTLPLLCTIVMAKLVNSDRLEYNLTALVQDFLGVDISPYEKTLQPYLKTENDKYFNKDYGNIPTDIVGEYATIDVIYNRPLFHRLHELLPEDCYKVWQNEIETTRGLVETEQNGLNVDRAKLLNARIESINARMELDERIVTLCGRPINPKSKDDVEDLFCGQYGMPVLKHTLDSKTKEETDNASFDKEVLELYRHRPEAPKGLVDAVIAYRKWSQLDSLFLIPWLEYERNGVIKSSYNQAVRSGRMSCSMPNMQQLNEWIKQFIEPRPGYTFCSMDESQIEFRTIVHYINDLEAIAILNENPDADFHDLVTFWCNEMLADYGLDLPRSIGKTVNFGVAFGLGKGKLIKKLSANEAVADAANAKIEVLKSRAAVTGETLRTDMFDAICYELGSKIYDTYHARFNTLKPTLKFVERRGISQGYVRNLYGRRRHLKSAFYRYFNTLNQGSAADIVKYIFCRMLDMFQGTPLITSALVHDEILIQGPSEVFNNPQTLIDLIGCMERPGIDLKVPIRSSYGLSNKSWLEAKKNSEIKVNGKKTSRTLQYDKAACGNLEHLKTN